METKILEIRDTATFIAVVAINMNPDPASINQYYLLRRSGYACDQQPIVLLTRANGDDSHYDYYDWPNRTMRYAHEYIQKNWDKLKDGDVVDVEFILGESKQPKQSERFE